MPELFAEENCGSVGSCFGELRKRVFRMLVGIGCEREKGFDFRGDVHPTAQFSAVTLAPCFGGECALHGVEYGQCEEAAEQILARVNPINDARELAHGL